MTSLVSYVSDVRLYGIYGHCELVDTYREQDNIMQVISSNFYLAAIITCLHDKHFYSKCEIMIHWALAGTARREIPSVCERQSRQTDKVAHLWHFIYNFSSVRIRVAPAWHDYHSMQCELIHSRDM